jgi:hypothetical protein
MKLPIGSVLQKNRSATRTQWMFVLERGGCEIGTKALYAQRAGASAVVVINSKGTHIPHSLSFGSTGDAAGVVIPVALLSEGEGKLLNRMVEKGTMNGTAPRFAVRTTILRPDSNVSKYQGEVSDQNGIVCEVESCGICQGDCDFDHECSKGLCTYDFTTLARLQLLFALKIMMQMFVAFHCNNTTHIMGFVCILRALVITALNFAHCVIVFVHYALRFILLQTEQFWRSRVEPSTRLRCAN